MGESTRSRWMFAAVVLMALAAATWEWRVSPALRDLAGSIRALARHDARLHDWAQLSRYRTANRSASAPDGRRRVVFLGDSITDFWRLPESYLNRGIWGQTSAQMLVRFRPDVLDLHPAAVVIHAGTNDIAGNTGPVSDEEIEANIESMTELAAAHGVRVILASLLPVSDYHRKPGDPEPPEAVKRPAGRLHAVSSWLRAYAARSGAVYLDYYSSMMDVAGQLRADFSDDDLHPNDRGYAAMAPLAEDAIRRALR